MPTLSEAFFADLICWDIQEIVHPRAAVIGKEVRLPSGRRIDLLTLHEEHIAGLHTLVFTVLEVKARAIHVKDLLQLGGYLEEIAFVTPTVVFRGLALGLNMNGIAQYHAGEQQPDLHAVVDFMPGIEARDLSLHLSTGAEPAFGGYPTSEGDPVVGWNASVSHYHRQVHAPIWDEILAPLARAWERQEASYRNRFLALTKMEDTPPVVAYGSGNGRPRTRLGIVP